MDKESFVQISEEDLLYLLSCAKFGFRTPQRTAKEKGIIERLKVNNPQLKDGELSRTINKEPA